MLCLALGGSVAPLRAQDGLVPQTGVGKEIFTLIEAKRHPYLTQTDFSSRADDLQTLYKAANHNLIWLNRADSAALLTQTLDLLSHAADEGLNPHHYDVDMLKGNLPGALQLPEVAVRKRAMFDTAVSLCLLRYLHDLHYGRVNPHGINFKLKLREKKMIDLPMLIIANRNQGQISQLQAAVEPKLHQYRKLKKALAHYRKLAAQTTPLDLTINKTVRVGAMFPQAEELKRFLTETGDLPDYKSSANAKSAARYDHHLSGGVKNFQSRHGLAADGILGKETAAALNVRLAERATQIELAMERIRWLPDIGTGPYIIVNIPAFQMWVFDDISKAEPEVLNMRVVVGQAMKTQTPVLMAEMRFIDFMPYWNVPYSITKNEIVPKLLTNPGYLNSENMEIVAAFSDHAQPIPLTLDSLLQLKQGQLKIRQRPGKKNPLGTVKFMFPNKEDVYLHDTPSKS
ncbi:MAG: L,D-transpeptidase family protein, partial [Gammaproteobacteria bacterium]